MPDSHEHALRSAGLRVTKQRTEVLRAVERHPHADCGAIHDVVLRTLPGVSRQAVYDCLNTFADSGLLRRIEPAGSSARYELRVGDNHHHLICRTCNTVVDVDCAVGSAPCLTAVSDHGFAIDEAEVIYWGWCPNCAPADQPSLTN